MYILWFCGIPEIPLYAYTYQSGRELHIWSVGRFEATASNIAFGTGYVLMWLGFGENRVFVFYSLLSNPTASHFQVSLLSPMAIPSLISTRPPARMGLGPHSGFASSSWTADTAAAHCHP